MPANTLDILRVWTEYACAVKILTLFINCNSVLLHNWQLTTHNALLQRSTIHRLKLK